MGSFMNILCLLIAISIETVKSCRGGKVIYNGITLEEKTEILNAHNNFRASVAMGQIPGQPGAENMKEMVWDEELAARAQEWANQCSFKHDPRRVIDRFTMGQNMAIIWSTAPLAEDDGDFTSRIQAWFNEVRKYAFGASWSPHTGHYSQLVWGETNLVGCGFTYYKDATKYNKLYVCNYGPGGNVIGSNPYAVGYPACGNYGMDPSNRYQGLCTDHSSAPDHNAINVYSFKTTFRQQPPAYLSHNSAHPIKSFFNHHRSHQLANSIQTIPPKSNQPQTSFWNTRQVVNKATTTVSKPNFNHFGYDWSAFFSHKI